MPNPSLKAPTHYGRHLSCKAGLSVANLFLFRIFTAPALQVACLRRSALARTLGLTQQVLRRWSPKDATKPLSLGTAFARSMRYLYLTRFLRGSVAPTHYEPA